MTANTIYKSSAGQEKIMALYSKVLAHWPVPYQHMILPTKYGDLYDKRFPKNLYGVPEEEFKDWCRENDIKLLLSFTTIKRDLYEVDVDNLDFKPKQR